MWHLKEEIQYAMVLRLQESEEIHPTLPTIYHEQIWVLNSYLQISKLNCVLILKNCL